MLNPVPVERCEDGYKPKWIWRTEDCFIWNNRRPGMPRYDVDNSGGPWVLRVTLYNVDRFSSHRTLREARIEASRLLGVTP